MLSLRKSQKFFRSTREKKEEKINGRKDEPQNVSSLPINPKANNPTESEFGRKRTKKKKKQTESFRQVRSSELHHLFAVAKIMNDEDRQHSDSQQSEYVDFQTHVDGNDEFHRQISPSMVFQLTLKNYSRLIWHRQRLRHSRHTLH